MAQKNKKPVNVDFDIASTTVEFDTKHNCVRVRKNYFNIVDGVLEPIDDPFKKTPSSSEICYPLEVYPLQVALSLAAASVQQVNLVRYEQE